MPEEMNTQEQEEADKPAVVRMKREDIQALEEAAQMGKNVPTLEKELAMIKAGIDTDTALGKMFFKSYEGEMNKEALIAAAQEVGLFEKPKPKEEIPEGEKGSTQERNKLSNGGVPPGNNPMHPKDEGVEAAKAMIAKGGKYEHAAGAYLGTLVKRFAEGDERAARKQNDRFRKDV